MDDKQLTKTSKFLSLVLRHQPETIGLTLDDAGWADVDDLLERMQRNKRGISRAQLLYVVENNNKKRFVISEDGTRIRAHQGHSVEVDLGYEPAEPPDILYQGTPTQFVASIRETGLDKRSRHHVHLSEDIETATTVAKRRGKPVILKIDAAAMHAAGHEFYVTPNGVWLTDSVPVEFIEFP